MKLVAIALGAVWAVLAQTGPAAAAPLSLADAVRLALENNLDMEQAQRDVKAAEADVTGARSSFLPQVNWRANVVRPEFPITQFVNDQVVTFDQQFSSSASAGLLLFDGMGNFARYRQATSGRTAAEERRDSAAQGVVYETVRRVFEVRRSDALLSVQNEAKSLSGEQLKKTEAMKELGAATQADVYKAEVDYANNRLAALRTERDFNVAKASLASYLGLDPREDIELTDEDLDVTKEYDLGTATDQALETNPELQATEEVLASVRHGVGAEKAARWPSLSLSATHQYTDFEIDRLEPGINSAWSYVLSMNFRVFDGLLTKSNIRRAEANLLESRRAVESMRRDVVLGVRQAHLDLEIAKESITVAEEAVRSSEEDLRLAQERYKIGEGTILDVIDAQVNLTRSRTDLVTATYDARLALLALRRVIGDIPVPELEARDE
jgi:TolC family type I secretion outer membrane protein